MADDNQNKETDTSFHDAFHDGVIYFTLTYLIKLRRTTRLIWTE